MQEYEVTIELADGQTKKTMVSEGTALQELAREHQEYFPDTIVLAVCGHHLRELSQPVQESGPVSFLTMTHKDGKRTYRRSVTIMMQKAVYNLWGSGIHVRVYYSLGQGYYCELIGREITAEDVAALKAEMERLAEADLPIKKKSIKTREAEKYFQRLGMYDKERLMHYRRSSRVNIYDLDGLIDYHYGYMVPSTGYLKYFDLELYEGGFMLLFPDQDSRRVEPFAASGKLHQTLKAAREWGRMLNVGTIGALNDAITAGRGEEIILTQEALMEARIEDIAAQIAADRGKKFVMIAGPSSSGKTTFSNRLAVQLVAKGLKPYPVALDDYYVNRTECPKDADGNFDFECLEAIDVELFNRDMSSLLAGEEVELPFFNFKTGMREYRGRSLKLGADDVLVIEGIHGLNDRLSYSLPAECKFRIYLSALTQLSIDEHNPLPTTDGRLIRRIVRDAKTRSTSAQETIAMWPSVRRGEEKNIFPFQDSADVVFNSALIYEAAVLKAYAEPLLFQIPEDSEEYLEAKRLLKFLDYFLPLPTEIIARNSLIREFIGGSCFNV